MGTIIVALSDPSPLPHKPLPKGCKHSGLQTSAASGQKTAALLEGHLRSSIGLKLLTKDDAFQFFSYLFYLGNGLAKTNFAATLAWTGNSASCNLSSDSAVVIHLLDSHRNML